MLHAPLLRALRAHAAASYPLEACGFIVRGPTGSPRAVAARNEAGSGARFEISAGALMGLRRADAELLAFYHSHPDGPARMSARDQAAAVALGRPTWPGVDHVVIAVPAGLPGPTRRFAWHAPSVRYRAIEESP